MIKGIIFDFDGTLFDSMEIWNHIAYDYLCMKGIDDPHVNENVANMSMHSALSYIKNYYHITDDISVMKQEAQNLLYNYYAHEIKPKKGAIDFLEYLSSNHIQTVILSASSRQLIEVALSHYQMEKYFDEILCCDELKLDKNNAQIFLLAIEKMKLSKQDVLIVEDAYHAIETAKSMGLNVLGIYDESEKRNIKPLVDFYIHDYQELEDYINEKSINNCRN
ncbi:MAG: HAD family phosphatase [Coprobacillus sp.]